MKDKLKKIKDEFLKRIKECSSLEDLEKIEKDYLGRKRGKITLLFKKLKTLPPEERPSVGALLNQVKKEIKERIEKSRFQLRDREKEKLSFDITLPGKKIELGHLHPITQFLEKVINVFLSLGFEVVEGREIETEKYNFDLLNIPSEHPARDVWDTFYLKQYHQEKIKGEGKLLLRTHTSPMQIRAMEKRKPPVRLIIPGRVFRHEATDPGHETTFYQCEGLVIDKEIKVTDLIGTLKIVLERIFKKKIRIRVRPSYYPFVEPGLDIDMQCLICGGKGCSVCKQTGWLEMLGSGMVHPQVLKNMGLSPEKYSGFAFGMGIDRMMMFYYGVNDVRLSYSGDLRFINQF